MYVLVSGCLLFLNILNGPHLNSQKLNENGEDLDLRSIREEVFVRTDRDIYITGEQVWLKVYELNSLSHTPWEISKVVYLELLDKSNFPVKQLKVKTDGRSGSSVFVLPDNISSGNYVIRAYTNWMKNWPEDLYFHMTISVINPFENIDHFGILSDSTVTNLNNRQTNFIFEEGNGEILNEKTGYMKDDNLFNFTIVPEKKGYSTREKVKVEILATDREGNPVKTDLAVSVAKSSVVKPAVNFSFNDSNDIDYLTGRMSKQDYLPELEGHLISGYIRSRTAGESLKNIDLSLALVGKTARCQFGKTDENGQFNFVVKETGMNEIVIQPLSADLNEYYVELNQPFSNKFSNYKPTSLYIDSSKLMEINNVIVSMQINNIYESLRHSNPENSILSIPDFYGKPENTIKMTDYIELTSVREVVKEIIPNVYTLKQNGRSDFKLINKFRGQPFENKPLILLDGIPIYDIDKVLNINSKEIERIDVINTRYFFSEYVFDGIVSFVTDKGNLSAIEFDNSIFRQVYEGYQRQNIFYCPDYSTDLMRESRIPDFRNTLYWKPDLQTGMDGKTNVEFFTSDESGDYTIIVEGISSEGKKGFTSTSIKVR